MFAIVLILNRILEKKLFDRWYLKTQNDEFSKINFQYEIPEENVIYHLSFIFKTGLYKNQEVIEKVNFQLEEFTNLK